MADRVELAFRRAAADLIPRGSRVLAAVSGGGDSVALLHLLRGWARRRGIALTVAHLDHGLRRGSRADRRFVERLAASLGLPCLADRREVDHLRRRDESPEESARRVRRSFLLEARRSSRSGWVATGHNLDDQAETILMRLARGSGAAALAGMAPAGPGPFVRPLLEIERSALRRYLARGGFAFRDDPSNRDLRHDRNRLRRLVLPVLTESINPRAARNLVRSTRRLRDDLAYLDDLAREAYRRAARGPSDLPCLDVDGLRVLAPPIATRVAHLALRAAGADPRRISSRHVDALMKLTRGPTDGRLDLADGVEAIRNGRSIALRRR